MHKNYLCIIVMVYNISDFKKDIIKRGNITEFDQKIAMVAFAAFHQNIDKRSKFGKFINQMIFLYQSHLQKNDKNIKKVIERDYFSYFFPQMLQQSPKRTASKIVKVGAGSPEERQELLQQAAKVGEHISNTKLERLQRANEERDLELSLQLNVLREEQIIAAETASYYAGTLVKSNKAILGEMHNISKKGELTLGGALTLLITYLFKNFLLNILVKPTYNIMKLIWWDSWVVPIKAASKYLTKPFIIILGFIFIISIGGVLFSYHIAPTDPNYSQMCNTTIQTGYCDIGKELVNAVSSDMKGFFSSAYNVISSSPGEDTWQVGGYTLNTTEIYNIASYTPPLSIPARGRSAWNYIGSVYGEAMQKWISEIIKNALRESADTVTEIAVKNTLPQWLSQFWYN